MKRRPFHGDQKKSVRKKRPTQTVWIVILSVTAVLLVAARFIVLPAMQNPTVKVKEPKPQITNETRIRIRQNVQAALDEYLIQDEWQKIQADHIEIRIPRKLNFLKLYGDIDQRLSDMGNIFTDCREVDKNRYVLDIRYKENKVESILFKRQLPLGYVAIVIDDFGYVYNDLARDFLRFRFPITISIIPGLQESRTVAREASLFGKEVLAHIPMEPFNAAYDDNGFLLSTSMENSSVRMRLRQAFSQLPNAIGINNHQGSKATADKQLMRTVMGELKLSNKFFVDSYTTPKTVGYKIAQQMGVKTAVNKLFIDAKYEEQFMNDQFDRITEMVLSGKNVVAIGHVRKKTLQVLLQKIPELDDKGIEFVPVSTLVK